MAPPNARFHPINLHDVPTLPTIVTQVFEVMRRPTSSAHDVEKVVVNDQAISAKILRVANSAFYGFPRRITTIAHAIAILGFNNVQSMILGIAAFDAFRAKKLNLYDFWKHSIATGTAARFIAQKVQCPADEAFTAGILHDVGKLIFVLQAENTYQNVLELQQREESPLSSLEAEQSLLHFTHPEAGAVVAERWALPRRYVAAIAHHHDPAAAQEETTFCAVIALSNHAAHTAFPGAFSHPLPPDLLPTLLETLRLQAQDWEQVLTKLSEAQEGIEAFVNAIR
ncbi:MAG: HDOD domain-containing protein [Abditibacteriales bacterium]|nr:HDOD domain-containing protein [Abditibacteriales bacterium]MDW8366261.1 HDOD domain-containing protein [Abditibacteriales bacterium]